MSLGSGFVVCKLYYDTLFIDGASYRVTRYCKSKVRALRRSPDGGMLVALQSAQITCSARRRPPPSYLDGESAWHPGHLQDQRGTPQPEFFRETSFARFSRSAQHFIHRFNPEPRLIFSLFFNAREFPICRKQRRAPRQERENPARGASMLKAMPRRRQPRKPRLCISVSLCRMCRRWRAAKGVRLHRRFERDGARGVMGL